MSVCFDIFHPSRIGTISYPFVLYQFRCLALGHNTVILTSMSLEQAIFQFSHCTPHRHERLRQTLSMITLILFDSLLLVNKTRHADNSYLPVWILKRNVSFRRFFWVPRRNYFTNDFFFKIPKLTSPNDISNKKSIKNRLFMNPDAIFLVLDTCICSYSSLRWSCFLIIWKRNNI